MPITQPANIVRCTWRYDLQVEDVPIDVSEHSVTFLAGAVPTDPAVLEAVLNDMATAALASQTAHFDTSYATSAVRANSCRVALESTAGLTLFEKIVAAADPIDWQGDSNGAQMPWEDAVCVSVYGYEPGTFSPAGKYQRGRFYLPPLSSEQLATGKSGELDPGHAQLIMDNWQAILTELQNHLYSGFPTFAPVLGIVSRHTDSFTPASWLRIDTKVDTQRRRQNKIVPTILKDPFPATG